MIVNARKTQMLALDNHHGGEEAGKQPTSEGILR